MIVALQIAYLPALYSSFNRREGLVALLESRAGVPAWGPELLARHQLVGINDTLPELYAGWEVWAADVAESHTTYPVLLLFRSPEPWYSWLLGTHRRSRCSCDASGARTQPGVLPGAAVSANGIHAAQPDRDHLPMGGGSRSEPRGPNRPDVRRVRPSGDDARGRGLCHRAKCGGGVGRLSRLARELREPSPTDSPTASPSRRLRGQVSGGTCDRAPSNLGARPSAAPAAANRSSTSGRQSSSRLGPASSAAVDPGLKSWPKA